MLENPKVAKELLYNYRGVKIKGTRNESWVEFCLCGGQNNRKNWIILAIKRAMILVN